MRFSVLTSLIPVLLLLAAPPAIAQIESCHDYVARANSQVQMAQGCNFPYPSGVGRLYAEDLIVKIECAAGTMIVSV